MAVTNRLLAQSDEVGALPTLYAATQVLGKMAVAMAPREPQLQHAALRLTARGWETAPLPAPDGSGALVVALDLRGHEALVEHSDGGTRRIALTPDRAVGEVARELLEGIGGLAGPVQINPTPQEVSWSVPLDEDDEHARYDRDQVAAYFAAATRAALVLAEFRAPFRGRSTAVNAWWGSFDLAVSLFSGVPAEPPSDDFIMRNSMDAQEFALGWWPRRRALRQGGVLRIRPPVAGRVRRRVAVSRRGALGSRPGRVRPRLGRRVPRARSGRVRTRVRALRVPSRVRRLRVGSGASRQRRGHAAARPLSLDRPVRPGVRVGPWPRRRSSSSPKTRSRRTGSTSCRISRASRCHR